MHFDELKSVIEALIFVSDEPITLKQLVELIDEASPADIEVALQHLESDYRERRSGLELREIAGGWRLSSRPEFHEYLRRYAKSKPSSRLSLAALETLAVIAYKQPVTIPEILEIRGVSSSSAIKTLLDRKLIIPKGRKECVGRPMMYGTSKDFLLQFGLKDLTGLPNIEDLEDLSATT
ncbi:MAG TPA: SMC-Scp complex subunit ScpB [Acidobacteriota bacterium]|nr:SMC-Scp complex subunit ScpB [Acidobacteriota bacterium]HNB69708.1 SMC-Scp complex subunit ScpB [Acidobacteriota bacterium]HNC42625.1 SMC-Scp complex subunit ScpB [Acidobacteriota bacterium]HNG96012.1 SMC-Scp complex subunit ScpB [Acidobacteriota bacterium]HNH81859.1 SMC-Scp complex subunit ScpB [Acidobacteriota bacterium]